MNSTLDEPRRQLASSKSDVRPDERTTRVCVVGLGYVGLPLAVAFDRAGHHVTGFDTDAEKIDTLLGGVDTTGDVGNEAVAESEVAYTSDPYDIRSASFVVIAVPTPIDETNQPDMSFVEGAGRTVGRSLTPGTTVVLESTVYPGATREVLVPALSEASGLTPGEDFSVGYSPERATPGDPDHGREDVVKVVSGQDEAVLEAVAQLYETIVDAGVHRAPSIEVAEAAKVAENVQRDVNIALVNELTMAFERLDVDTWAVLDAAGTKWNFHDYRPGLVGGHCIPVDPYFFTYQSQRDGFVPKLTLAGRSVNESMPAHVSELAIKALNASGKAPSDCRVAVLGVTYKPDVPDVRTSKVTDVVDRLREYDVSLFGMDPYVDDGTLREVFDLEPVPDGTLSGLDGAILATPHAEYRSLDFEGLAGELAEDAVFVDVTAAVDGDRLSRCGITYVSL